MLLVLVYSSVILAVIPAILFLLNLTLYKAPARLLATGRKPAVSLLIPARNEERSISAALASALASVDVELEVIVLDDGSLDRTAEIVRGFAARDSRVQLAIAPPLPEGWCGKQFACSVLATLASHEILSFCDADVRLSPDGLARMIAFLNSRGAALVSGFPHQETITFFEKTLLPLMHFILLGFLPMGAMRRFVNPAFAAGCGQLFLARKCDYEKAGGHSAIRGSRHDGITLPKAFRYAGLSTDLCDATGIATCRMYRSASEVFSGLLKNATEGIAAPSRILIFSILLFGGQVLPFLLLLGSVLISPLPEPRFTLVAVAAALSLMPRILAAFKFRQSLPGALLQPFSITLFLLIQWYACIRHLLGTPAVWKGRFYPAT